MDSSVFTSISFQKNLLNNKSTISNLGNNLSKISFKDSILLTLQPNFQQNIQHINCFCYHCINDTRPLVKQAYPRIKSSDQYTMESYHAYPFIINNLIDFVGPLRVPDTFIAKQQVIVYFSNSRLTIKSKPALTFTDYKKSFDPRKAQYVKILKDQYLKQRAEQKTRQFLRKNSQSQSMSSSIKKREGSSPSSLIKQKQLKQVAIISYTKNYTQLITDPLLTKYLSKRKNDPFWSQVSTISLIPPFKQPQLRHHQHKYQRNQQTIKEINSILRRISQAIDKNDIDGDRNRNNNPEVQDLGKFIDILSKEHKDQLGKKVVKKYKQTQQEADIKQNFLRTLVENAQLDDSSKDQKAITSMSHQIIAYIQLKRHIQILSANFKFVIDYQGNLYLSGVQQLICVNLKSYQLTTLHDRMQVLQPIDTANLCILKQQISIQQRKYLLSSLSCLVLDCLQKRKLQLNQQKIIYKRLNQEQLIKIFKRIFVNFNQDEVFLNHNWRNQYQLFLTNSRKKINQVITGDQGISILKRFGITFYRTWD